MLTELARRIRASPEGKFEPSPLPQHLDKITDELLIVASDAVSAVGAESPPLSGNGVFKLLAWTVADARGACTPLDKALALTVGKRLDRQAVAVRAKLEAIKLRWSDECDAIRLNAASNTAMTTLLPLLIESALVSEQSELHRAREEVYIGFHELDALLPEWYVDSGEANESDHALEPVSATEPVAQLTQAAASDSPWASTVHFPWLVDDTPDESCPVPPDLAGALTTDALQMLWQRSRDFNLTYDTAAQWWSIALPGLANHLVHLLARQREDLKEAVRLTAVTRELCKGYKLSSDLAVNAWDSQEGQHGRQIEELEEKLKLAETREEALKGAIALLRPA